MLYISKGTKIQCISSPWIASVLVNIPLPRPLTTLWYIKVQYFSTVHYRHKRVSEHTQWYMCIRINVHYRLLASVMGVVSSFRRLLARHVFLNLTRFSFQCVTRHHQDVDLEVKYTIRVFEYPKRTHRTHESDRDQQLVMYVYVHAYAIFLHDFDILLLL